jgi:hypothetical protein
VARSGWLSMSEGRFYLLLQVRWQPLRDLSKGIPWSDLNFERITLAAVVKTDQGWREGVNAGNVCWGKRFWGENQFTFQCVESEKSVRHLSKIVN